MFNNMNGSMFGGSGTPRGNFGNTNPLDDMLSYSSSAQNSNEPMIPLSSINKLKYNSDTPKGEPTFSVGTLLTLVGAAFLAATLVVGTYYNFQSDIKDVKYDFENRTKDIKYKLNNIETKIDDIDLKEIKNQIENIKNNINDLNNDLSKYNLKTINKNLEQINKDIKDIKIKVDFNRENILSNKKELNKK
ncbi:hypothetical protein [Arcobacter sp. CECT 8985]|uniref:hypothetical protein n=1 Tax=Arcobacter sp. CECT 8985 TaxID=1935424 RepID=UPI00100A6A59|nr:hypothetical protein [Arcobacter sp. CECT 8985]RXJ87478.1 hypothetical protein CRU93_03985 [Arcobacter sp. CECT 8985]